MTYTIGVAGIGSIGAQHVTAFHGIGGVEVVAWDPVATSEQIIERTVDGVRVVSTFAELLDASEDGVIVASPDHHHAEQVIEASRAGRAVLVEKPVAPTSADVVDLLERVGHPDRVLVGYVLHHHESMLRASELVSDGAIGTIASFHATVGAYDTLRLAQNRFAVPREGTLYIDYSHEWDAIRWLVGPMRSVVAVASVRGELPMMQTPNVVDALFRGATVNGDEVSGTAHLDYLQDPGLREFTLVGDRGALIVSASERTLRLRRHGEDEIVERYESGRSSGLAAQARHFLQVSRGETAPRVTLRDGLAALRVAEAVRESAAAGTWIDIDNDNDNEG